jgi:hypothetical protein
MDYKMLTGKLPDGQPEIAAAYIASDPEVCHTGLEPRTDRPLTGQVYCSHVWCLPWTARQNDPSRHDTRQRLARRASRHADSDATPRPYPYPYP